MKNFDEWNQLKKEVEATSENKFFRVRDLEKKITSPF